MAITAATSAVGGVIGRHVSLSGRGVVLRELAALPQDCFCLTKGGRRWKTRRLPRFGDVFQMEPLVSRRLVRAWCERMEEDGWYQGGMRMVRHKQWRRRGAARGIYSRESPSDNRCGWKELARCGGRGKLGRVALESSGEILRQAQAAKA